MNKKVTLWCMSPPTTLTINAMCFRTVRASCGLIATGLIGKQAFNLCGKIWLTWILLSMSLLSILGLHSLLIMVLQRSSSFINILYLIVLLACSQQSCRWARTWGLLLRLIQYRLCCPARAYCSYQVLMPFVKNAFAAVMGHVVYMSVIIKLIRQMLYMSHMGLGLWSVCRRPWALLMLNTIWLCDCIHSLLKLHSIQKGPLKTPCLLSCCSHGHRHWSFPILNCLLMWFLTKFMEYMPGLLLILVVVLPKAMLTFVGEVSLVAWMIPQWSLHCDLHQMLLDSLTAHLIKVLHMNILLGFMLFGRLYTTTAILKWLKRDQWHISIRIIFHIKDIDEMQSLDQSVLILISLPGRQCCVGRGMI